jgi:octaprenyl-diphosphate synthase
MVRLSGLSPTAQKPSAALLAQMFEPIRGDLRLVEEEFQRHVQSQVSLIPAIGKYIQNSGGKRIRPAVLLMAARMSGYTGGRAILYASVVEFIHTATLVHDDIVDEAELRRGRQAVHARWGNDVTVLLGDFLYIKSMSLALTQDSLEIIRLLCDVTLQMIEGELDQLAKNGRVELSEDDHFEIIRRKTAYLFAGCSKIGGMLGVTTHEQQDLLWDYGFNIGMAFQVVDDLLDFTGEEAVLGKPVGGDLLEGKMTLPVIHLMNHADGDALALVRKIVKDRTATMDEWRSLCGMLAQYGSIDYARLRAERLVERAKRALDGFPPSDEREALVTLPDYVLSRDQ